MAQTTTDLRQLLSEVPLPLAQLGKRALNARGGTERHASAFYVAEATLKLAASARISLWLQTSCEPSSKLAASLEALALPSLGHWCGFLREVGQALAESPGAQGKTLADTAKQLSAKRPEWQHVAELSREAVAAGIVQKEVAKQAGGRGALGFFEILVAYRNEVIGHGAQRSEKFYQQFARLLLQASGEVLGLPALLGGLKLAVPRLEMDAERRGTVTTWTSLMGLAGLPLDEDEVGRSQDEPMPGELYLIDRHTRIPLHPLIVFNEDEHGVEHFGFLNRTKVKSKKKGGETEQIIQRVEFLDYVTGESVIERDACAALTNTLSKLRGAPADTADVNAVVQTLSAMSSAEALRLIAPARAAPAAPQPAAAGRPGAPAAAAKAPEDRLGEVIADKYRLVAVLGSGGMGTVFAAEHVDLPRSYALKVLNPGVATQPDAVDRFKREAQQAAGTRHAGIVDVLDFGRTEDGSVYLVMEPLEGEELGAALVSQGPLSVERAVQVAIEALDALAAAHERGVVHRDLKPSNLFLARDAKGEEHVKILDFGIAKVVSGDGPGLTQTGSVLGTPIYMSPEQIQDASSVDARADIYSLGATLYQALTGEQPVAGVSVLEVIANVVSSDIRRDTRRMRPETPDWLADIIIKAMADSPADRFQSAPEMKAALERGLAEHGLAGGEATAATMAQAPEDRPDSVKRQARLGRPVEKTLPARPGDATVVDSAMAAVPVLAKRQAEPAATGLWAKIGIGAAVAIAAVIAWKLLSDETVEHHASVTIGQAQATATAAAEPASAATAASSAATSPSAAASSSARARPPEAPEGMIYLPGGSFTMGSDKGEVKHALSLCQKTPEGQPCDRKLFERETPPREVTVSGLLIDQHEVTNARFAEWLNSRQDLDFTGPEVKHKGVLLLRMGEQFSGIRQRNKLFEPVPGFGERPVTLVTWTAAARYCRDRGARLPTEAEWEYAARGPEGRRYSWGQAPPSCDKAIYARPIAGYDPPVKPECHDWDPGLAEALAGDRTATGIIGLAGNAREWVLDEYQAPYPPCPPPCLDPGLVADPGEEERERVIRGGGFWEAAVSCRAARRSFDGSSKVDQVVGFRCAKSAELKQSRGQK